MVRGRACEPGGRKLAINVHRVVTRTLLLLFLPNFFSFAGHIAGFILVGKVFGKVLRMLGLGERKGRWVVEQDSHGNF